jgi:tetratricopeptide (TPR) repeat protein
VAGVSLYQSRVVERPPAAAPTEPGNTGAGAESLLPKAVLPPGGEERRVVQPIDTGDAAPGLGDFTAFSRAGTNPGPKPTITIERSAVRPFASGSAGALAVSRFDALNVQAAKLISAYEIDKATEIVEDILSRDPTHFGALLNRGRIGLLRDSFEAAHADFARARQVKPQSVAAALGESEALLGQRRGADALKIIEAAIAANPGEVAAFDLRARAHAQTGQGDQISVDCGELSWKLGLSYVGKWCEAMAYKEAGRTEDATAAFRAALDGASEEFVRHRQRYLKFRGHYPGEVDGQAGPATNAALAACAGDARC